jgi:hypothetical protein
LVPNSPAAFSRNIQSRELNGLGLGDSCPGLGCSCLHGPAMLDSSKNWRAIGEVLMNSRMRHATQTIIIRCATFQRV